MALKDFTLSNARRFYSSMGNPFRVERIKLIGIKVLRTLSRNANLQSS